VAVYNVLKRRVVAVKKVGSKKAFEQAFGSIVCLRQQ